MKSDLEKKVIHASLTKTEKKIAEYILDNYLKISFMSVMEVANTIGISDTSVIRLSRKLGYSGYTDLQNAIKDEMQEEVERSGGIHSLPPGVRLIEKMDRIRNETVFEDLIEITLKNIEMILDKNGKEIIEESSECIINSKRKFVVGFRGSAGVAELIGGSMGDIMCDVRTITHADAAVIEALMDIDEDDCLILISVPRYSKMVTTAMQIAKEANAKVILITDKLTSPHVKDASIVLIAGIDGVTHNNSYIALNFLGEVIIASIMRRLGPSVNGRLEKLDKYISENDLF